MNFLCSFRPLMATARGRAARRDADLPPFIDGSCRREPDLQATVPSITCLCRSTLFAPRLWPADRVVYITNRGTYDGDIGWRLVAVLIVERRFDSHAQAADWYRAQRLSLPSNCMVADNPPQPFGLTNQRPPAEVAVRLSEEVDPVRAVRLWDAVYARRARNCGVFLACRAEFLNVHDPPILRRSDHLRVFGRVPGTQNPPAITDQQYDKLAEIWMGP